MIASDIGRNDPCPCGSGKKFKNCHLGREEDFLNEQTAEESSVNADLIAELERKSAAGEFTNEEDVNRFLNEYASAQSARPLDDFHGLSPAQMHGILYAPFETPSVLQFPNPLEIEPDVPATRLFRFLYDGLGEKGMKTTATGYLLRNFCREAMLMHMGREAYDDMLRVGDFQSEFEAVPFHMLRLASQSAGLVRKTKGRFYCTKKSETIMKKHGMRGIYPLLFHSYCEKLPWDHYHTFPPTQAVQFTFAFSLYLLSIHGDQWRPVSFYEDAIIRAFPALINNLAHQGPSQTPETALQLSYQIDFIQEVTEFFGLVEIEREIKLYLPRPERVRALPLLNHVVQFQK